jgi:hypothetical protein
VKEKRHNSYLQYLSGSMDNQSNNPSQESVMEVTSNYLVSLQNRFRDAEFGVT